MEKRPETGISVLVYYPFVGQTEEHGWVKSSVVLGIVSIGKASYIIDQFGTGSDQSIEAGGEYNLPIFKIEEKDAIIGFQAKTLGLLPIGRDALRFLEFNRTMDLADFIIQSPEGDYRLDEWATFVRAERYKE